MDSWIPNYEAAKSLFKQHEFSSAKELIDGVLQEIKYRADVLLTAARIYSMLPLLEDNPFAIFEEEMSLEGLMDSHLITALNLSNKALVYTNDEGLTKEIYEVQGFIWGILARHAEQISKGLSEEEKSQLDDNNTKEMVKDLLTLARDQYGQNFEDEVCAENLEEIEEELAGLN